MNKKIERLRNLAGQNRLQLALDELRPLAAVDRELQDQALLLAGKFKEIKKKAILGLISSDEAARFEAQLVFAVLELFNELEKILPADNTVFMSYNHADASIAERLRSVLAGQGIEVIIDSSRMLPGMDIREFIVSSIRDAETTIGIVSVNSLYSAWVAMEITTTWDHQEIDHKKRFIPCYTDEQFLEPVFVTRAISVIGARLQQLEDVRQERVRQGLDSRDLNTEYSRLLELYHSIDRIIGRLRDSLCVDISAGKLESNLPRIIEAILK